VEPGFLDHIGLAEQAEMVGDFATTVASIVTTVV